MAKDVKKSTAKVSGNSTTKVEFKPLTEMEISALIQSLITENNGHLTISALKKMETSLTEKYGKSNWIAIRGFYQSLLKHKMYAYADKIMDAIKDYNNALIDQWKRIETNSDFIELAKYIGIDAVDLKKNWKDGQSFVAKCFPHIIDNVPAKKVSLVSNDAGFIIDVMRKSELTASNVPAILCSCIRNIRTTANKSLIKGKVVSVKVNSYKVNQIVSVFYAKDDAEKIIVKGDAVSKEIFDKIRTTKVDSLSTVFEYRKDMLSKSE